MLFNTAPFFVFLALVLALFYGSPRTSRKPLLLIASYFFYATWNVRFIPLLVGLTAVDYAAALWISRTEDARRRKLLLVISLIANLGFLAFFKYTNFLAHIFGVQRTFDIVLPLGISFHTFQSMSYVIDVYRREQEAVRNPVDYALFVAFFPQLVAGPIVRAREFFVDLYNWRAPSSQEQYRGALLVLLGLTKKMALADQFASVADAYFSSLPSGALAAWSGVAAFALQIFFDFSGYTDMAIGMALLFGFHFPENFRRPYLAQSITEFWQRWHMSLSRWLRDYLYIPLGGNRGSALQTYRNLMLTMLLGGLWHGASWNFVIWGGWHGALLSIERVLHYKPARWNLLSPLRILLTLGLVSIGWVFFRAKDLPQSLHVIQQMFSVTPAPSALLAPWQLALAASAALLAAIEERFSCFEWLTQAPAWVYAVAVATLLLCLELFGVTDRTVPFIYFQF